MRITFDSTVRLQDGTGLELVDLVLDPTTRAVTHLVLRQGVDALRLVPVGEVTSAPEALVVGCDRDRYLHHPAVSELSTARAADRLHLGTHAEVGVVSRGPVVRTVVEAGEFRPFYEFSYHRIPVGSAEVRHRSPVTTGDGHTVGHVAGVLTDPEQRISSLLVERDGLLRGRPVVVPAADVAEVHTDGVVLTMGRTHVLATLRADVRAWWERVRDHHEREAPTTPPRAGLRAARPSDAGIVVDDPDSAHDEACHVLANEAAPVLAQDGFTRDEVWEWAEAFLADRGSGDVDDLVAWIGAHERPGATADR